MAKPRIIIADTDRNYILSLQQKFIKEFFEKAELEIITDPQYFAELFSMPQRADLLICSEDLYDLSLQRHSIAHLFLLSEKETETDATVPHLNRIYKYTSVIEIFGEVLGKSDVLHRNADETQETQIVLVTSAAGGAGKTTVSMGLSAVLSKRYKRILYLDAEPLQTFQRLLQNREPIAGDDVYERLKNAGEQIYEDLKNVIREEMFHYFPPFKAALISLGLSPAVFRLLAVSAKYSGKYDYIFVDTDSTFDENKAALMDLADRVIIVTGQNAASVEACNALAANIHGVSNEKYMFLCNNCLRDIRSNMFPLQIPMGFKISGYVEHLEHYDQMKAEDFAEEPGFQKAAFLLE